MKHKLLAVAQAIVIALVILAGAIALPILCRFFFYLHIEPYGLTEAMGLTAAEIKTAYNEMMDYCMGLSGSFSAGVLPFSAEGAAHFADVRKLFILDLAVLAGAVLALIPLLVFGRKKALRLGGHTPGFWASVGLGVSFLVVGGLAALDFDRAFVIFHQLFFPGKDNWIFDYRTDPIITMLPEEFFRNCAILILAGILIGCGILIGRDLYLRRKK
jgi:integral membrane protein (TIGR01906 family)